MNHMDSKDAAEEAEFEAIKWKPNDKGLPGPRMPGLSVAPLRPLFGSRKISTAQTMIEPREVVLLVVVSLVLAVLAIALGAWLGGL
jgi:hypothetical protein